MEKYKKVVDGIGGGVQVLICLVQKLSHLCVREGDTVGKNK